jgi:hypothetical protein
MIYSIDEYRDKGKGHLIDGKTLDEVYAKVAKILERDNIDVLHFRKCNYYGNINNKFSYKRHVVRRASNSIMNH